MRRIRTKCYGSLGLNICVPWSQVEMSSVARVRFQNAAAGKGTTPARAAKSVSEKSARMYATAYGSAAGTTTESPDGVPTPAALSAVAKERAHSRIAW